MAGGGRGWARGRCIGRGSTASVYLAASTSGEPEAFVVKSAELYRSAPLQREEKILSSLCSPHVVSCLGADVTAGPDGRVLYNLFMEYVPGGSLADSVKQRGGLEVRTIRLYTRGILHGLSYLHSMGVVHSDVKGHNVLLGEDDGSVKLADFGCARWVDGRYYRGVAVGGTPLYMAPEVARGEEQGPAADIWALGCTVIEMATGSPPWHDVDDPVAAIHRIAFSDEVPQVPRNISDDERDFLGRCLNRDPRNRWSAEELLNHPFVEGCEDLLAANCVSESKNSSPKSVLDQGFWDSSHEEVEQEGQAATVLGVHRSVLESAHERLRQLARGGVSMRPAANATRDETRWITVRNVVVGDGECLLSSGALPTERFEIPLGEGEPPASRSGVFDAAGDGGGSEMGSAGCSDCCTVATEEFFSSNRRSHFCAGNDGRIVHMCRLLCRTRK